MSHLFHNDSFNGLPRALTQLRRRVAADEPSVLGVGSPRNPGQAGPRPGHNQGTIPRTPQGATGADRGDSERIGASQNSAHEGAVPWAVRNSRNTRTSTPT